MSVKGVKAAAKVFAILQNTRINLLKSKDMQDIYLAQMLSDGQDAMQDRFLRLTISYDKKGKIRKGCFL